MSHLDDRELSYGIVKTISDISDRTASFTMCIGRYLKDKNIRNEVHSEISKELGIRDIFGGVTDLCLEGEKTSDIVDTIYDSIIKINPDVILIQSEEDLHQDHVILSMTSKIAIERYIRDSKRSKIKVIEVLHTSMFNRGDDFLVVELNDDTYLRKKELCSRFFTEKLDPKRHEYFRVYSSDANRIKKHNLFSESALKDFVLN